MGLLGYDFLGAIKCISEGKIWIFQAHGLEIFRNSCNGKGKKWEATLLSPKFRSLPVSFSPPGSLQPYTYGREALPHNHRSQRSLWPPTRKYDFETGLTWSMQPAPSFTALCQSLQSRRRILYSPASIEAVLSMADFDMH